MSTRTVTLAVVASLGLGACGDSGGAGSVNLAPAQAVTIPIAHDLGNLDPAVLQGEAETEVAGNVFDSVVRVDTLGGRIAPADQIGIDCVDRTSPAVAVDQGPHSTPAKGCPKAPDLALGDPQKLGGLLLGETPGFHLGEDG
jgi:hypothetical protein